MPRAEMDASPSYRRTFARLLGFLRPYKVSLGVSIVLAAASQAAQVAIAFLTGTAVGRAIQRHDRRAVELIVAAVVAIGLVKALLMVGRRLISGRQALGVEFDMRNALYARLVRLSFGFYDRHQTGQLMSRATVDLQSVRFFLGYGLIFILQSAITILIAAAVMLAINVKLAAVALAPTPVVIYVAFRYGRRNRPASQEVQQRIAELTAEAEENVSGVRVVKAFAQEERELRR